MDLAVRTISPDALLLHRIPLYFSLKKKTLLFSIQSRFSPGSADHQESVSCAYEYIAILKLGGVSFSLSWLLHPPILMSEQAVSVQASESVQFRDCRP